MLSERQTVGDGDAEHGDRLIVVTWEIGLPGSTGGLQSRALRLLTVNTISSDFPLFSARLLQCASTWSSSAFRDWTLLAGITIYVPSAYLCIRLHRSYCFLSVFKLHCKRHYRNLATYSWCTTWSEHVTKTAPARRRHSVGGGGAPISYDRRRRRQQNGGGAQLYVELLQLTVIHYINNRFSALVIGCYFYLRSWLYDLLWWSYDEFTTKLWRFYDRKFVIRFFENRAHALLLLWLNKFMFMFMFINTWATVTWP